MRTKILPSGRIVLVGVIEQVVENAPQPFGISKYSWQTGLDMFLDRDGFTIFSRPALQVCNRLVGNFLQVKRLHR